MRVCYFGTYERDYPRNRIIIDGLRRDSVQVFECHIPLWELARDKTGPFLRAGTIIKLLPRILLSYVKLIIEHTRVSVYDVMIVGYLGQLDMLLARILTAIRRRPLVFNPLISLYDTLVMDRESVKKDSLKSALFHALDRESCRRADIILLDTHEHIEYFSREFGIRKEKFRRVFLGADDHYFFPQEKTGHDNMFNVLFVGKFSPLHGLEHIIKAAEELEVHPDIQFQIIGSGQLSGEIASLVKARGVSNVSFLSWVRYEELNDCLSEADLCLGIFGKSEKARRVIPNKVFMALAMRKPVITEDSLAMQEAGFIDGENIILCEGANPRAIANSVLRLKQETELREQIARNGYKLFKEKFSPQRIGEGVKAILKELIERQRKNGTV